jgi:hypothetical protein
VFIILLLAALYFKANISGLTTFEPGEEGPATLTWAPEPAPEIKSCKKQDYEH